MAHIYMHFDFGVNEEKAQEARHKLDVWKQAFRLDKKLQYKLDRPEDSGAEETAPAGDASPASKESEKPKSKSKARNAKLASGDSASESNGTGNVSLLVRLYFSSHEKLSEQRWLDRIPSEEPFKGASPKVMRQGEAGFDEALKQFAGLD